MVEPLHLVRDVLDKQIFDTHRLRMGKVDGIVLVLRQHRAPRVEAIELDASTLWSRVHPWLGRIVGRLLRRMATSLAEPTRVRFEHVVDTGLDVHVDIDVKKTNAYVVETWLKEHLVDRIPGGRTRGSKQ